MASENRSSTIVLELFRLGVVSATTAGGYALGQPIVVMVGTLNLERTRLLSTVLGALLGYVLGGAIGRRVIAGVDEAQRRLQRVEAAVLIATVVAATLAGFLSMLLLWPVLLFPAQQLTIPLAMIVLLIVIYTAGRVGASRGGDLLRFVGARGRLEVSSPSRGSGVKLVDTSALIDARLVEVARCGFLDGTLVVPTFVLAELQSLADTESPRKRDAGLRGLQTLQQLQDDGSVVVEVSDEDVPGVSEVDAKLVALARERGGSLISVDGNLERVAEISGVRVLNLHALADSLRPQAIPGDHLRVRVIKDGREAGQGVAYTADGTMIVIEGAAGRIGDWIEADITSVMQTRKGRMLFANLDEPATAAGVRTDGSGGDAR